MNTTVALMENYDVSRRSLAHTIQERLFTQKNRVTVTVMGTILTIRVGDRKAIAQVDSHGNLISVSNNAVGLNLAVVLRSFNSSMFTYVIQSFNFTR